MFFGPSKANQQAAEIIDFYIKNIVGDLLLPIVKNEKEILNSLFTKGELDLQTWTNAAQLAATVYVFTSLSNSEVRGKKKLMELVVAEVKLKTSFGLIEFMDAYSHFCKQMLLLIESKHSEDRTEKLIFVLLGDIVAKKTKKLPLRNLDEILEKNDHISELFTIGRHVITPFMGYFR
jgi:hypothetical protein